MPPASGIKGDPRNRLEKTGAPGRDHHGRGKAKGNRASLPQDFAQPVLFLGAEPPRFGLGGC